MIRGLKWTLAILALLAGSAAAQTQLNGAGATFPNPIYSKWFSEYHKQHPDVEINYQPIGSGGGKIFHDARIVLSKACIEAGFIDTNQFVVCRFAQRKGFGQQYGDSVGVVAVFEQGDTQ